MKRFAISVALATMLTLLAACANTLPKPVNASGGVNPSVALAESEITYANVAHAATSYVVQCHAVPATIGCSDSKIAQIKAADAKAYDALQAAETAVKTLQPGATGIDRAISTLNAALVFLQSLVAPTHP